MFEYELNLIKNEEIRKTTEELLKGVPEYFWHVPASSSGKYHPMYALGEGGLVRHTKAAVRFAEHLFALHDFMQIEKDYIVAALLLHDTFKQGKDEGHTVHEHPLLAAQYVRENADEEYASEVCPLIEKHMGQWTTSQYSSVVLEEPEDELEKFVHECASLASRRGIEVELDE